MCGIEGLLLIVQLQSDLLREVVVLNNYARMMEGYDIGEQEKRREKMTEIERLIKMCSIVPK